MNPTRRLLLGSAAAALLLPLSPRPALALLRVFPRGSMRGKMQFVRDKEVQINGKTERLSPAVRVHDEYNRIPLRGKLIGKTFIVNYVRDPRGVIREVWILNDREIQQKMPREKAPSLLERLIGDDTKQIRN